MNHRPPKSLDYMVHRIAELIRTADTIHENKKVRNAMLRGGIEVERADGKVIVIDGPNEVALDEIALGVGRFICGDVRGKHLNPKHRPQILRQIAHALEGKSAKKRKSVTDDTAKIRAAWGRAKAKLKGLYRDDNPTFGEAADEYRKLTGYQLDRRALKNAGCRVRPDKRGVKKRLPRLE